MTIDLTVIDEVESHGYRNVLEVAVRWKLTVKVVCVTIIDRTRDVVKDMKEHFREWATRETEIVKKAVRPFESSNDYCRATRKVHHLQGRN